MRRLVLTLLLLVFLAAAVVSALLLSMDRFIAANRETILQQASKTIGRPLLVDRIGTSLRGGIGVRLENVRIENAPEFGADLLRAESVLLHLKLRSLLHGRLEFTRIDTEQPEVTLVRTTAGKWNYASLPLVASNAAAPRARPADTQPPAWLIAMGNVAHGKLVVILNSETSPQRFEINQLDLALTNISPTTPVRFKLVAAVDAAEPNVRLDGWLGPLQGGTTIPLECSGTLGPRGPIFIADVEAKLAIGSGDVVQITQFNGRAFGGAFTLNGQVPLHEDGVADITAQFRDLNLGRLLEVFFPGAAERTDGTAQMDIDIRIAETSGKTPLQTLAGTVVLQGARGTFRNMNLLDQLLSHSAGLGGIATLLSPAVKTKYDRLLTEAVTRFDTLQATIRLADQHASTDDLMLRTPTYELSGKGELQFAGNIDAALMLTLSPQLSTDIVADVSEAKYLLNERGQLALPFRWRGKLTQARPEPDPARLSDLLQRAVAHGAARDLMDRLLGPARNPSNDTKRDDTRRRLEQGLRDLFGH